MEVLRLFFSSLEQDCTSREADLTLTLQRVFSPLTASTSPVKWGKHDDDALFLKNLQAQIAIIISLT